MKANDILNKIKNIVGDKTELSDKKIALAEIKLENGTVIVSEEFKEGEAVFIKTEDKEVALPLGEYELEDGRQLIVKEEGLIDSIAEKMEEEVKEEEIPVEASGETILEEEVEEEVKEEMNYVTKEELGKAVEEIKAMIEDKLGDKKAEDKKEEMSAISTPPIKHNPEAEVKKTFNLQYGQNRTQTTADRVMNKIFQNN
tara:strand:+ start:8747 stop:9343 length:597 start_codon:yes stop_codon:yes gene_type:complete